MGIIKTKVKINQRGEKFFMQEIVKNNKRHKEKNIVKKQTCITLIALVITIVLNCSYLAMDQMNKIEKI